MPFLLEVTRLSRWLQKGVSIEVRRAIGVVLSSRLDRSAEFSLGDPKALVNRAMKLTRLGEIPSGASESTSQSEKRLMP